MDASWVRPGTRFYVQWTAGTDWQTRVALLPCSRAEYEEFQQAPLPDGIPGTMLWYAMTPDGDVYPHVLSRPPLYGLSVCSETDQIRFGQPGPRCPPLAEVYGGTWVVRPGEFYAALESCRGEVPTRRVRGKSSPLPAPGRAGAATPTEQPLGGEVGSGRLPADAEQQWRVVASSGPEFLKGDALTSADDFFLVGDVGLASAKGATVAVQLQGPQADEEIDARVLPVVCTPEGVRKRHFRDAIRELSESEWAGWPLRGPRTAKWCLDFIGQEDLHPRARHTKWRHESRLLPGDVGVADHELIMRVLELAIVFDQLNVAELASFELLLRKAQLAEWRHRDRLLANGADDIGEDEFLYLGTSETRGLLMVCPELSDHITAELHKEASVMKERRKLRDERRISRGAQSSEAAPSDSKKLQQKINQQAQEISWLKSQQSGGQGAETGEAPKGKGGRRGKQE